MILYYFHTLPRTMNISYINSKEVQCVQDVYGLRKSIKFCKSLSQPSPAKFTLTILIIGLHLCRLAPPTGNTCKSWLEYRLGLQTRTSRWKPAMSCSHAPVPATATAGPFIVTTAGGLLPDDYGKQNLSVKSGQKKYLSSHSYADIRWNSSCSLTTYCNTYGAHF